MLLQNFSAGVLGTAIGTGDTTINVVSGNSLPTASGTFTAIIWNSTLYSSPSQDPQAEIVLGQYASTNTYTITRAQENTAASPHAAGATIGLYITAGVLKPPILGVHTTAPQSIPNNTWTERIFGATDIDSMGYWSSNAYTPKIAGWYLISYFDQYQSPGNNNSLAVAIYKNGISLLSNQYNVYNTPNYGTGQGATVSGLVYLNGSTDYINFYVWQQNNNSASGNVMNGAYGSIINVG